MRRTAAVAFAVLVTLPVFGATAKRLDANADPIIVRPVGPAVTIDVKDAEAAEILKSIQKQCGVKNLMIDPQVKGKGTFYLVDVPCHQAWSVVVRSLGFEARVYTNSIIRVSTPRR